MNPYYFLATILSTSGVVVWLGKLIITKAADFGMEKYKAELTKEIGKHNAELSRLNLEYQIKFSKLHEERGEKIKLIYHQTIEVKKALDKSTTLFQGPEFVNDTQRDENALSQIRVLVEKLESEKIYFSNATVAKINTIITESVEILNGMREVRVFYKEYDRLVNIGQTPPEDYLTKMNNWNKLDTRMKNEFETLKENLANEFRDLLGINR